MVECWKFHRWWCLQRCDCCGRRLRIRRLQFDDQHCVFQPNRWPSGLERQLGWLHIYRGRIARIHYRPYGAMRFRMASDNSTAAVGWRVDTIQSCGVTLPSVLTFSAISASKNEGNAGFTPFDFVVSRISDVTAPVSVQYAVTGLGPTPHGQRLRRRIAQWCGQLCS